MPIYPFLCTQCKHQEDVLMSVKDYIDTRQCVICKGTMKRIFTPFTITGCEWNWKKGYRSDINDAAKETRYDLMKLEQNMTEEGNLKKYHDKKKALKYFSEAQRDILEEANLK